MGAKYCELFLQISEHNPLLSSTSRLYPGRDATCMKKPSLNYKYMSTPTVYEFFSPYDLCREIPILDHCLPTWSYCKLEGMADRAFISILLQYKCEAYKRQLGYLCVQRAKWSLFWYLEHRDRDQQCATYECTLRRTLLVSFPLIPEMLKRFGFSFFG